jgi:hypothetical protein
VAPRPDESVKAWVDDASAVARSEYRLELTLGSRDISRVSDILRTLRDRYAQQPLEVEALRQEVVRWGAVLGEIQGSHWSTAHWGRSKERNRAYGYSVYVPLEGGGWLESNEIDLAEGLITKAMFREMTIREALTLHFFD